MVAQGIDPRSVRYQIFPPALGTRDELVRAQVQLAHATTCRYLSQAFSPTGKQPNVRWMLSTIMGMDDETLEGLEDEMDDVMMGAAGGNSFKNDPPSSPVESREMAAHILNQPEALEKLDHLQWLLEERAIARRLPSALPTQMQPFGNRFDDMVRSMGIRSLRVAG
jgi:hypothetical protein